jgi:hypothetical protein
VDSKAPRLARGLYALIDDSLLPAAGLFSAASAAARGGAATLQLRLKGTPDREALALCRAVVACFGPLGKKGFYVLPTDPDSNVEKAYVFRDSLSRILEGKAAESAARAAASARRISSEFAGIPRS